jgi:hypothetical protein
MSDTLVYGLKLKLGASIGVHLQNFHKHANKTKKILNI